jgi:poly(U)-specific endoribonuclease
LLRSINVVVHVVESTCMKPIPLVLDLPPSHAPNADTDFNTAVQTLWNLDSNRLTPHKDYKMDVQNSKNPYNKGDAADEPLFTHVNRQVFQRPTFKAFCALLDNYSAYTGDEEKVTSKELRENKTFLNAIMETAPMKYCHQYCLAKEVEYDGKPIPASESGFKKVLDNIWFKLYSRSGGGRRRKMDSSGFEHVFVGEVKNGKVSGFHNWIMFWLEERKGNIDYRGYIKPRSRGSNAETNNDDPVLTLQFLWNGVEKFVGTSFIGVSPEFELALYTMTFLAGEDENEVTLDTTGEYFDLNVKCHKYDGGSKVGSCYVEALAHYED